MIRTRNRRQASPVSPVSEVEVHMEAGGASRSNTASAPPTPPGRTASPLDIALTDTV